MSIRIIFILHVVNINPRCDMPETRWSVDQKKSYIIVLSLKIKFKDFVSP